MDDIRKAIGYANENDLAATCVLLAERWLQDHPDDLLVTHDYADMLYKMARYDEALRVYHDALVKFERHRWGIYNQLGHLYMYRGDFHQAEAWYRKAIEEHPDEAASFIFLGAVQARQGNLIEAEATHRKGTLCSQGFIDEAFHNLGLVLRGQGRYAEAADCFRKVIEIDPEDKDAIQALDDLARVERLLSNERA